MLAFGKRAAGSWRIVGLPGVPPAADQPLPPAADTPAVIAACQPVRGAVSGQMCNHRNEEVRPVPKGPIEPGWPWQERCVFVFLGTSLFLYCSHPAVQQHHSHLQRGPTSVLTCGVGAEEEGCACTLWPLCFGFSRWHQGPWLASSEHRASGEGQPSARRLRWASAGLLQTLAP